MFFYGNNKNEYIFSKSVDSNNKIIHQKHEFKFHKLETHTLHTSFSNVQVGSTIWFFGNYLPICCYFYTKLKKIYNFKLGGGTSQNKHNGQVCERCITIHNWVKIITYYFIMNTLFSSSYPDDCTPDQYFKEDPPYNCKCETELFTQRWSVEKLGWQFSPPFSRNFTILRNFGCAVAVNRYTVLLIGGHHLAKIEEDTLLHGRPIG